MLVPIQSIESGIYSSGGLGRSGMLSGQISPSHDRLMSTMNSPLQNVNPHLNIREKLEQYNIPQLKFSLEPKGFLQNQKDSIISQGKKKTTKKSASRDKKIKNKI